MNAIAFGFENLNVSRSRSALPSDDYYQASGH